MRSSHRSALIAIAFAAWSGAWAEGGDRVARARTEKESVVRTLFERKGVSYPPAQIFLRAFKQDGQLELWAASKKGSALELIKTYDVCAASGVLGPKRQQGDRQVPEGFYFIDRFNPRSKFHLSLGIDYPNASDRIRGIEPRLGGDIFIHGSCVTVGCLPLDDGPIEELYLIALDARTNGQRRIPVHVFPTRLDDVGLERLKREASSNEALWQFWQELAPGYEAFEKTKRVPTVRVDPKTGAYRIR